MKIISKYKDYYDYLAGLKFGIDNKIILDRTNGFVFKDYQLKPYSDEYDTLKVAITKISIKMTTFKNSKIGDTVYIPVIFTHNGGKYEKLNMVFTIKERITAFKDDCFITSNGDEFTIESGMAMKRFSLHANKEGIDQSGELNHWKEKAEVCAKIKNIINKDVDIRLLLEKLNELATLLDETFYPIKEPITEIKNKNQAITYYGLTWFLWCHNYSPGKMWKLLAFEFHEKFCEITDVSRDMITSSEAEKGLNFITSEIDEKGRAISSVYDDIKQDKYRF